ncbi:ATP-binding cassette domain-containing protein [Brevibacillus ruminantium]|uniref:ATP-binding cassette domain-containing protein n=1 Tax=Brevibacillus ruminantium TaxID=2950604 RepID=A0ABY4WGR6_9BACL|nr:ATP-binding cassette domain-containing protein [Brevibacillus ruminantium]USG65222.1 ATP-binding cassette domain-containing protein [Brevibacillus ruminantium]
MSSSILTLEQLGKQFPSQPDTWLFSGISAEILSPEITLIMGKSGQGKSTLLRLLGFLDTPDHGTIRHLGKTPAEWSAEKWRMSVSYVAQHPVMLPGTVEENLQTVSRLHKRPFESDTAHQWMEAVGLGDLDWSKPAAQLSGGEKQRVALVRTLLLRPSVLLLDEVTASLDAISKRATEELLLDLHRRFGTTLLWITHDWEQARSVGQRVWFLAGGRLLEDSPAALFFHAPQTPEAREFLILHRDQKEDAPCHP